MYKKNYVKLAYVKPKKVNDKAWYILTLVLCSRKSQKQDYKERSLTTKLSTYL